MSGRVDACNYIHLACRRYLQMHEAAFQQTHGIYFCEESAIEACAFLETLRHVKGVKAGERFILEPWQIWIVCAIYGFRWASDGIRVVNTVYLEIPRKHGKSLLAAGLGLYETTVNAGTGDDLYIIAPKFDQGLKVLEPMVKMIAHSDDLRNTFDIKTTQKLARVKKTDSNIIVLAALGEKQDGHDPKTVIADEFHAVPADIYKVMQSAQRARPEALFIQIGSAGRHTHGIGWEQRRKTIEGLEGKIEIGDTLHVFAAIFTIDPQDISEWSTERVIRKANPNLGVSIDVRKTMQEAKDAKRTPTDRVEFLRTALNLWGFNEAMLFPKDRWDRCERPGLRIEDMGDRRCFVALDLASRNDMVAMAALFEEPTGNLIQMGDQQMPEVDLFGFAWHYIPKEGPWKDDADLIGPYRDWIEQGKLVATPGSRHDFSEVYRRLTWLRQTFSVELILIDDQQANETFNALEKEGAPVVAFRKNAPNFSDPTKDLMSRVNGDIMGFFHDGNPVLGWNMGNVIGGLDTADRILGKKPTPNSNQKIDGFDCLVMANAGRMQKVLFEAPKASATVERGMRRF